MAPNRSIECPPEPILLTGASGFVGSRLKELLQEAGAQLLLPSSSELDLRDREAVRELLRSTRPRTIFHLASSTKGRSGWEHFPQAFDINTAGSMNLLSASMEFEVEKFLAIGTGDENGIIVDGRAIGAARSAYAATKAASTMLIEASRGFSSLRPTVLKLFAVYGPNQSEGFFVPSLIAAAKSGQPLKMTEGEQLRDFTWLDDVADVLLRASVLSGAEGKTFDVCTGARYSLRQVVEAFSQICGVDHLAEFGAMEYRSTEMFEIPGDPEPLERLMGSWNRTSLGAGLEALATLAGLRVGAGE